MPLALIIFWIICLLFIIGLSISTLRNILRVEPEHRRYAGLILNLMMILIMVIHLYYCITQYVGGY